VVEEAEEAAVHGMIPAQINLADGVLLIHALLVLFNVGALPVIWLGYFRGWGFVRNFYFRVVHLVLIGVVAAESVLGIVCPLTTWEETLRLRLGLEPLHQEGFVAHWLHRLLFYDFPGWAFTVAYTLFFAVVLFTFYWVRPMPGRASR